MRINILPKGFVLVLCGLSLLSGQLQALDHANLDEGSPTKLEDAYAIDHGEWALEIGSGFRLDKVGPERGQFSLQLVYGALPNFQFDLGTTLWTSPRGLDEEARSGDLELGGLYNLNQESLYIPGLGIKASSRFPTGVNSAGTDSEVKGLITKAIHRLTFHFNLAYHWLGAASSGERNKFHELVFGATYPLGAPMQTRTTLVADLFTRPAVQRNQKDVVGSELGVRYQLSERVILNAGGLTEFHGPKNRTDFGFTTGLSYAF